MKTTSLPASRPLAVSDLGFDVRSLIFDVNKSFNPLHNSCLLDYRVVALDAKHVGITYILPNELLNVFSVFLESIGGFFQVVNNKARAASSELKFFDLDALEARNVKVARFNEQVCSIFDELVFQGFDKKSAVKEVNSRLKLLGVTWASFYIVEKTLRAAGRLKRTRDSPPAPI